jgi:hypothetical protein
MELTPEILVAAGEATKVVSRAAKLVDFIRACAYNHGNQLHVASWECPDCTLERRVWLETNHPNWKSEANEKGCCGLCLRRAYNFFQR